MTRCARIQLRIRSFFARTARKNSAMEMDDLRVAEKGQLLIKVASVLSIPVSLACVFWQYFQKKTPTTSVPFGHPFGIFVTVEVIRKLYDFTIGSLCEQRENRIIKKELILEIFFYFIYYVWI